MSLEERLFQFAQDYATSTASTLRAHIALSRAHMLLEDAERIKLEVATKDFRTWFGYEVFSYYTVGFVTCLEWHARARICDLFTHQPETVTADDFKMQINSKFFSRMVRNKVTLPELLAASVSIGSAEAYLSCFARIFKALNMSVSPWDILRNIIAVEEAPSPGLHPYKKMMLEHLFIYRNHLVHEIDSSIIGRPWQRDAKTIDDVIEDGKLTISIIQKLERCLSERAPKHFPGLLDNNWYPKSDHDNLEEQIKGVEFELAKYFAADENNDMWRAAVDAAGKAMAAHDEVIMLAPEMSGTMSIRLRESLHIAIRRNRLELLLFLKQRMSSWFGPDPLSEEEK
jgi:hypothetical protein